MSFLKVKLLPLLFQVCLLLLIPYNHLFCVAGEDNLVCGNLILLLRNFLLSSYIIQAIFIYEVNEELAANLLCQGRGTLRHRLSVAPICKDQVPVSRISPKGKIWVRYFQGITDVLTSPNSGLLKILTCVFFWAGGDFNALLSFIFQSCFGYMECISILFQPYSCCS